MAIPNSQYPIPGPIPETQDPIPKTQVPIPMSPPAFRINVNSLCRCECDMSDIIAQSQTSIIFTNEN